MGETLLKKESPFEKFRINVTGFTIFAYGSAALFLLVSGAYGLLLFLNHNLKVREPVLEQEIKEEETTLKKDLHDLLLVDSRFNELKRLVANHRFSGRVFELFEKNTLLQVQFSSFNLSGSDRKVNLIGEAASFRTLAQQISLLENHPDIQGVEFGGLSLNAKNRVNFALTVIFNPSLFGFPPAPTQ